jgi:exopolysaccharide production negative regulator
MNRKSRVVRISLAILFCMIAERAIAQVNFERPSLEGAIKGSFAHPPDPPLKVCGVINDLISIGPINQPALSVQPAPSITSKQPVPPTSVPESAPSSLLALQNAADDGDPIAQWELGRMFAEGKGVAQNDLLAFDYFSRIANAHSKDSPSAPQAKIVANAFVALGSYHLNGIPNSSIKADQERAREMFSYAASYFRYAARWLGLAGQKGQHQAQALLGQMLFDGDCLPRQAARGLMWLTVALDSATADETWIRDHYNNAIARASDDDRAMALQMLEHWVQGRRD